jgi:hypothetical protein
MDAIEEFLGASHEAGKTTLIFIDEPRQFAELLFIHREIFYAGAGVGRWRLFGRGRNSRQPFERPHAKRIVWCLVVVGKLLRIAPFGGRAGVVAEFQQLDLYKSPAFSACGSL